VTDWLRVHHPVASAGVWLTAEESEISAALWAKWHGMTIFEWVATECVKVLTSTCTAVTSPLAVR